ncbi:MAG: hypothetical protein IMF09_01435 [Proteobacteria bacterium]|nr:hypothetical protein [Pseudomonadota bacterium]
MRFIVLACLLGLSSLVSAQMPAGMQEAISCMESIDQAALEALGEDGEKFADDIKAMCKKGDESGARKAALKYMKEMESNESLMQLKKCSEMMQKVMPGMVMPEMPTAEMYAEEEGNICDNID